MHSSTTHCMVIKHPGRNDQHQSDQMVEQRMGKCGNDPDVLHAISHPDRMPREIPIGSGGGPHQRFQIIERVGLFDLFVVRSEEHTSELQSRENLVCRLLLEKKKD